MKHKKEETAEKHEKKEHAAQIEELTDLLKRVQAEFENYKKRVEKENQTYAKRIEEQFMTQLLPLLDAFELALKNNKDTEQFRKGIELMYAQFVQILRDKGLTRIDALQKPFDPYLHEVMLTKESEADNVVLEELQKGYACNGRVLRHSKVTIGKKTENGTQKPSREEENPA